MRRPLKAVPLSVSKPWTHKLVERVKSLRKRQGEAPRDEATIGELEPTSPQKVLALAGLPRVILNPSDMAHKTEALAAAMNGDLDPLHTLCARAVADGIQPDHAYRPDDVVADATASILADALVRIGDPDQLSQTVQLIETLSVLVRSGSPAARQQVHNAIETLLLSFDPDLLPNAAQCADLARLLMAVKHSNSQNAYTLAQTLVDRGHDEPAAVLLSKMLKLMPKRMNCFNLLTKMKPTPRRDTILAEHLSRLEALAERDDRAAGMLGRQLVRLYQFGKAARVTRDAAARGDIVAVTSRADALFWADQFEEAQEIATSGLDQPHLKAGFKANLYLTSARCSVVLGAAEDAVRTMERRAHECGEIASADPTHVYVYLAAGRPRDAYEFYWRLHGQIPLFGEARRVLTFDELVQAHRTGTRLPGHCVITSLTMGLGDEIQSAQMMPQIAALFDEVTVLCDPRIQPFLSREFSTIRFQSLSHDPPPEIEDSYVRERIDRAGYALLKSADYALNITHFLAVLRQRPDDFPSTGHHLNADPNSVKRWTQWLADEPGVPHVGLFWRCTFLSKSSGQKTTQLLDWLNDLSDEPVRIVPLQYDLTDEERRIIETDGRIRPLPAWFDPKQDMENLAGLLAALPLTLTVPGTTHHLAGAVGANVVCATHPYQAPWRRVFGRAHDAWSPCVQIVVDRPELGLAGSCRRAVRLAIESLNVTH